MRFTDEPGFTIRCLIGDERADELSKLAFAFHREHGFNTEELAYLEQLFGYYAWMSSFTDEEWREARGLE